ncbi:membrane hypothetical protein [Candidatus Contendobacter odensis Run_B_J11]|uniref:Uncharacterized protein n=1 Tax=Candidatus Contendobacter odensis Run_B_J11 TaxID=1400861 RepID=A0A7U7GER9_9GAMM|nr:membrane hypothetical protein [Candidatus Contendobacter odensis Run_B_J11]
MRSFVGGVLWRLAPPLLPRFRARWLVSLAVGACRRCFARWSLALPLALRLAVVRWWSVAPVARTALCAPLFLALRFSAPPLLALAALRSRLDLLPWFALLPLVASAPGWLCFPPRLVLLVCCLPRVRWPAFVVWVPVRGLLLLLPLVLACGLLCSRAGFPRCRLGVCGVPWRVRGLAGFCWCVDCCSGFAARSGRFFFARCCERAREKPENNQLSIVF